MIAAVVRAHLMTPHQDSSCLKSCATACRRMPLPCVLACAIAAWHAPAAHADRVAAAAAYDEGAVAYSAGDYERAARAFDEAFRQAPAPEALLQAARSYERAGDRARAATLCLAVLESYAGHETAELAEEALAQLSNELVQLEVACEGCAIELDGAPTRRVFFVEPGDSHTVIATLERGSQVEFVVNGAAGDYRVLKMPASLAMAAAAPTSQPAAAAPTTSRKRPFLADGGPNEPQEASDLVATRSIDDRQGLSPSVAYVGVALTGVLAAAASVATISAAGGVSDYEAAAKSARDCARGCDDLDARASGMLQDGRDRESLALVAWAAAGATGLATAAVALFLTDWRADSETERGPTLDLAVAPAPAGADATVTFRGRF